MLTLFLHPHTLPEGEDPAYYSPDPRAIYKEAVGRQIYLPISYGDMASFDQSALRFADFVRAIDNESTKDNPDNKYGACFTKVTIPNSDDAWNESPQKLTVVSPVVNALTYAAEIKTALLALSYYEQDILNVYKNEIERLDLLSQLTQTVVTKQKTYLDKETIVRVFDDLTNYRNVQSNRISRATFTDVPYEQAHASCSQLFIWFDSRTDTNPEVLAWRRSEEQIDPVILYAVFVDIDFRQDYNIAEEISNITFRTK